MITSKDAVIEVRSLTPANKGNLKAFVSVCVNDALIIHGVKIIQQDGQRPWIAMPSHEYTDRAGTKKYAPIVELAPALKAEVERAVLGAWQRQDAANTER